jgi:NAD(P)-dependent dehydrogenase (short-subunit alcohol dehydrogenase family)
MPVTYQLAGRTAVVTGGAGSIGRAIAGRLLESRARVVVWDIARREQDGITSLVVDVTDPDQVASAIRDTLDETDRIDILVNSVGYLGSYGPFEGQVGAEWPRILGANLVGVLEVCRQVLPHMPPTRAGRVVTMGSFAGKHGLANLSVYSAASAGVIGFTKALAEELAGTEIRVNCVAPGPIDSDLIRQLGPAVVESMVASSPLKRLGTPDEVAELVLWLCSDACSFTTGAVFDVSGGRAKY